MLVMGLLAGLVAGPLGLAVTTTGTGAGLSLVSTASTVYARPGDETGAGTGTPDAPSGSTSTTVQMVNTRPTGNSDLDALCSQAADLINDAIDQSIVAGNYGDAAGAVDWINLAAEMRRRATTWGCKFTSTRSGEAQSNVMSGEAKANP